MLFITQYTTADNLHNKIIKHRKTLHFKPCPLKCKMRTAVHAAVNVPYKEGSSQKNKKCINRQPRVMMIETTRGTAKALYLHIVTFSKFCFSHKENTRE
jgi:hypothetical protein